MKHRFQIQARSHKLAIFCIVLAVTVLAATFWYINTARGATYTWDGGGADNNWSTCANWTTDTCPTSADIAHFDSSTTTDSVLDASFGGSVAGVDIDEGYTGTITQERNLTIGGSHYNQDGGTWKQGTTTFSLSGSYTLSGGTFEAGTGTSTISGNFSMTGGSYNASSTRTITFVGTSGSTMSCPGAANGIPGVNLNKSQTNDNFTLSNCIATSSGAISHPAPFTVNSDAQFHFSGSINLNNGFTNHGTSSMSGTTFNIDGSFTQNGHFDLTGKTVNMDGNSGGTLSCAGNPEGIASVDFSKSQNNDDVTISNCTATSTGDISHPARITVGSDAQFHINGNVNTRSFTNNGTTTMSGTTFEASGGGYANFTQNAVFDLTGISVKLAGSSGGSLSCPGGPVPKLTINMSQSNDNVSISNCTASTSANISHPAAMTLGSGTILDIGSYNFTVSGSFSMNSGSEIRLHGDQSFTTPSLASDTTVVYTGTSTYSSLVAGTNYHHLKFTGGGTYNIGSNVAVAGDLTLTNGTTYSTTANVDLSGDLAASENARINQTNGTFTLEGGTQTVTGTSTFNNLTKSVTATSAVYFGTNQEQTVSGTLTLQGDPNSTLYVKSTATGTQYKIDMQSFRTLEYITISDGNNTNSEAAYCDTGCVDDGNNTNILFTADPDEGKVYWDGDGATNDWSECANWKLDTCPTATEEAAFDGRSVKDATINASFGGMVKGLSIESGYTGTITGNADLTIGTVGFSHIGGTYTHSSGTVTLTDTHTLTSSTTTTFNNVTLGAPGSSSGLLSHWGLDDNAADTTVADEQSAYSGTASQNTSLMTTDTRKRGIGAFDFDGTDDYVSFGDIGQMDAPGAFSVSLWFRRDVDNNDATNHAVENVLVAQSSNSDNDNFEIGTDGSSLDLYLDTGGGDTPESYDLGINDGTWYHLVVTYDSSRTAEVEIYLDSVLVATSTTWGGTLDSSAGSPFSIGIARAGSDNWGDYDGLIDDVRLYTSAITAGDVGTLYGGKTVTLASSTLDVNGDFTLGGGNTLDVSADGCAGAPCNIELGGDWTNNNGTFEVRTATVTLNGTNQTISGETSFYNLKKNVIAADTLFFEATTEQIVTNNLSLTGSTSGALSLKSTATGTQFSIDMPATRTLEYLIVQDANNTDTTEASCTNDCLDSGNNTNWDFGSSAHIYWDGDGGNSNWSTCDNWTLNICPDASSTIAFDSRSTKDATIDSSFTGEVQGLLIQSGYTGTITAGADLVIGSVGFSQDDGTFSPGSYTVTFNNGGTIDAGSGTTFNNLLLDVRGSYDAALARYWTFDDNAANTTVTDTTGNDDVTASTNTANLSTSNAKRGTAFDFNGSNEYICLDDAGTCSGDSSSFFDSSFSTRSFSLWFKPDDTYSRQVLFQEGGSTNGVNIYIRNGSVYGGAWAESNGWNGAWYGASIATSTWYHVVLSYSSSNFEVYVNGESVGSTNPGTSMAAHSGDDSIGNLVNSTKYDDGDDSSDFTHYYDGIIDEFRVYTSALSDTDAAVLADNAKYLNATAHTVTLAGTAIDVDGDLQITGYTTLDASPAGCSGSACDIVIGGDWLNSGSFTPHESRVTFDGTSQTLSGNTVFWDLMKSVSSPDTVTFASGDTFTVKNKFIFKGASGNLLTATSSGAAQWKLNANTYNSTLEYLSVSNSNSVSDIDPMYCTVGCVDEGNNTNWLFGAEPEPRQRWRIDGNVRIQGNVRYGQ